VLSFVAGLSRSSLLFFGLVLISTDLKVIIFIEVIVINPRDCRSVCCKCLKRLGSELTFCSVFSQDTLKIKQIDAIVSGINSSAFQIQRDTLIKDHPEMGLKMTTYLSMVVNGGELLKYVNLVNTTMTENGATRQITTSSSFYYDRNKLIKVEEYFIEVDKKKTMDWYYAEDKPLYYSLQSDKAENRANLLLTMSETMLKQVIK
jgi:hypothetical protein